MVFSSNVFLSYFLPIVLFVYFLVNPRLRNTWLLFVSLFFYAWGEPDYVVVMILSIMVNYIFGRGISYFSSHKIRKILLVTAILCNLGILFYFKYLNFFADIVGMILKQEFVIKNIVLPIGISFYTFQGLTYIVDVYREDAEVQKNPIKLGLYIAMFPQLIAGPIIRYKDIENQISERSCNVDKCFYGIGRFVQGLAKKAVIANTIAEVADRIFAQPAGELSVATAWLGVICYTFQIYFDFSGYSDMAIGLGKILGFDFTENFDYPYSAISITEFWRRWHISLSSFFRDYVYIPLGGNRRGGGRTYINLALVFLLTGLWHGASFNFILWGLWHGAFIVLERFNMKYRFIRAKEKKGVVILKYIYTMLVVMVGWVFFRSDTIEYAIQFIGRMFNLYPSSQIGFKVGWYLDKYIFAILCIALVVSLGMVRKFRNFINEKIGEKILLLGQSVKMLILMLVSIIYVITSTYNPFIYFKF